MHVKHGIVCITTSPAIVESELLAKIKSTDCVSMFMWPALPLLHLRVVRNRHNLNAPEVRLKDESGSLVQLEIISVE